jgi:hypothetical protein
MSANIVPFAFDGDELHVVPGEGRAYVVVRAICEVLGVDFSSQLRKLKRDPSVCVAMFTTQMPDDDQRRETACLDVRSLPLWLAGIHPSKAKPAVREKLIRYKREAAEVLADHFLGRRAPAPSARALTLDDLDARVRAVVREELGTDVGRAAALRSASGPFRAHALFPCNGPETRDIHWIAVQRKEPDGSRVYSGNFHRDELATWADVQARFGGGSYKVIAKDRRGVALAWCPSKTGAWFTLPGKPRPLKVA